MAGNVAALVGGQYGSEGKGLIASKVADMFDVHIRTGAPNAGHTYYIDGFTPQGEPNGRAKVVARSVPVGACNPNASLVIGPGGILDLRQFRDEVNELNSLGLDVSPRLFVDEKALIIDHVRHADYEGGIRGRAHSKIGSTGEGVGIARMAHLARGVLAGDWAWGRIDHAGDVVCQEMFEKLGVTVCDTAYKVNKLIDMGANVLLEGTQGSGLSSVHGPWPYCTSTDTNAGQLCTDAGISPRMLNKVLLVARVYPIRVAGNSGPLSRETTWEELDIQPEFTTVTKKMRRVGLWDNDLLSKAITLNRPCQLAITFVDYLDHRLAGSESWVEVGESPVATWLSEVESRHNSVIAMVGTGPDSVAKRGVAAWS